MKNSDNLKNELIKQMDTNSETIGGRKKSPEQILAIDTARLRRLKRVTIFSWILSGFLFIIGAIIEKEQAFQQAFPLLTRPEQQVILCLPMVLRAMLTISLFLTIMLYVRAKTLSMHQIQARLSNIEMLLKKMCDDK